MAAKRPLMVSPVNADTATGRRSADLRSTRLSTLARASASRQSILFQTSIRRLSAAAIPSSPSTFSTSCSWASESPCDTSRTCRITSASMTSSRVARNAATSIVGRSEMKPTVSDRMALTPRGSSTARSVGSSVANSMSADRTVAAVSRLKSVDFPAFVYPTSATIG